jgi:DNA primase
MKKKSDKDSKDDASSTTKYIINARFEVDGVVEKPDVVGAVFGQTEGLLGDDLDLRELQKTGRIGRIDITVKSAAGKSTGTITIPSSLDRVETAILAAALEVVDRVGPCTARIIINKDSITDVRETKRKQIITRASSILRHWNETVSPESQEIQDEIIKKVRVAPISKFGAEKLPAGPGIKNSNELIIVEGRADILNLLKCDIQNTVAVEGTKIPPAIAKLTKSKDSVVAFLDGDRGGDLILKELLQVAKIDYVARAPKGKEVEDLTRKEILKALQTKRQLDSSLKTRKKPARKATSAKPITQQPVSPKRITPKKPTKIIRSRTRVTPARKLVSRPIDVPPEIKEIAKTLKEGKEKMQAVLVDKDYKILDRIEVRALAVAIKERSDVFAVVFDGIITQRLIDITADNDLRYIVGQRRGSITKKPSRLRIYVLSEVLRG